LAIWAVEQISVVPEVRQPPARAGKLRVDILALYLWSIGWHESSPSSASSFDGQKHYSILGIAVDRSEALKLARTPVSDNLRYCQKVHAIS
jgi:hypothetical protein